MTEKCFYGNATGFLACWEQGRSTLQWTPSQGWKHSNPSSTGCTQSNQDRKQPSIFDRETCLQGNTTGFIASASGAGASNSTGDTMSGFRTEGAPWVLTVTGPVRSATNGVFQKVLCDQVLPSPYAGRQVCRKAPSKLGPVTCHILSWGLGASCEIAKSPGGRVWRQG